MKIHRRYSDNIKFFTGIQRNWIIESTRRYQNINDRKSARNITTYDFSKQGRRYIDHLWCSQGKNSPINLVASKMLQYKLDCVLWSHPQHPTHPTSNHPTPTRPPIPYPTQLQTLRNHCVLPTDVDIIYQDSTWGFKRKTEKNHR